MPEKDAIEKSQMVADADGVAVEAPIAAPDIRRLHRLGGAARRGRSKKPVESRLVAEGVATSSAARRDALHRRLLAIADMLAATLAFTTTILVLGHDSLGVGAAIAIPTVVLACKLAGLYDRDELLLHKTTLDEAPALFRVATLYTLFAFITGDEIVRGRFGNLQAAALWSLLFASMLLMRYLARRIAGALSAEERCVVLGSADSAHSFSEKLRRSQGIKATIVGRVSFDPAEIVSTQSPPVLGAVGSLEKVLEEHSIDRAVIAPGQSDEGLLLNTIRTVKRFGVRVTLVPTLFEVVGSAVEFDDVEGATLLGVRRHGLSRSSSTVKRAFDLVGASVGLLVLAPLMTVVAIAIKLDSRGPVLFRQRRVGRHDEVFEICKFRTMADGADAQRVALASQNEAGNGLFKIADDPRITRVGRFLRRTSLDELPQFLNVLQGDMALVGPRPLVVDEDRRIQGCDRHRMLLPPGVTGLWQILGSARIPLDEMIKIDYLYGANWSLWLDIKILLRTVPFVVGRRGL